MGHRLYVLEPANPNHALTLCPSPRADVKDDDCGSSADHFSKMRDAIAKTGRPMVHTTVLSLRCCSSDMRRTQVYSIHSPWTHHPQPGSSVHPSPAETVPIANSARTTNDITASWEAILDRAHTNNAFANLSQPGYFNDVSRQLLNPRSYIKLCHSSGCSLICSRLVTAS